MSRRPPPRNPVLSDIVANSYGSLADFKQRAGVTAASLIDLSVGDPGAIPDPAVSGAVAQAVAEASHYPATVGIAALREAVAGWYGRRFGVTLDPDRELLPTVGSKEAIATFPLVVCGEEDRPAVVITEPGYSTYDRGARFAGAQVVSLPLDEASGWLPDVDAVPAALWNKTAILWVNYPHNPTGAVAPLEFYEQLADRAARYGFYLASDEPYTELYWGTPQPSALQVSDRSHVVVFSSLSKRSGMTGFRSGVMAGPAELIAATRTFRAGFGLAPPTFVQRGAVAAWNDEAHVDLLRAALGMRHRMFADLFDSKGVRFSGREATPYLWVAVPEGRGSEDFAEELLRDGVAVAPGNWFGHGGEGWIRIAAVASEVDCVKAVDVLERHW